MSSNESNIASGSLVKANSFSFRRRYFLKATDSDYPVVASQTDGSPAVGGGKSRTMSLKGIRCSPKPEQVSQPDAPPKRRMNSHSNPSSPPPVSHYSIPKLPHRQHVQQLSTSWEYIR